MRGKSVSNQRIEAWWSIPRKQTSVPSGGFDISKTSEIMLASKKALSCGNIDVFCSTVRPHNPSSSSRLLNAINVIPSNNAWVVVCRRYPHLHNTSAETIYTSYPPICHR